MKNIKYPKTITLVYKWTFSESKELVPWIKSINFCIVEDQPLRCDVEKFQAILLFCTMGTFLQPIGIGMDLFKCLFLKVSFNQNPSY